MCVFTAARVRLGLRDCGLKFPRGPNLGGLCGLWCRQAWRVWVRVRTMGRVCMGPNPWMGQAVWAVVQAGLAGGLGAAAGDWRACLARIQWSLCVVSRNANSEGGSINRTRIIL